jgi:hypothetical protein
VRTLAALSIGLAFAVASTGCSSKCKPGPDARGMACAAGHSREGLVFGMSRSEAEALMGSSETVPPWHNEFGLGPESASNPFDSQEFESQIGETYDVVRYFVEIYGNPACPFIQGRLVFEPLIFVDDRLVGWEWTYLEDAVGERLGDSARIHAFGIFCRGAATRDTGAAPAAD